MYTHTHTSIVDHVHFRFQISETRHAFPQEPRGTPSQSHPRAHPRALTWRAPRQDYRRQLEELNVQVAASLMELEKDGTRWLPPMDGVGHNGGVRQ